MKYFLDTEFIEGFHKPMFGKRRHHIDLISIGIVAEDGRTYSAISSEYNYHDASDWVRKNVIIPLYTETVHGDNRNHYDATNFQRSYGLPTEQIAADLLEFFGCWRDQMFWRVGKNVPDIYGYYADYDWVLFCSIFGKMIDLPKGFPMYCRDLKQMMDAAGLGSDWKNENCPEPSTAHNALSDARWNKDLYEKIFVASRNPIQGQ